MRLFLDDSQQGRRSTWAKWLVLAGLASALLATGCNHQFMTKRPNPVEVQMAYTNYVRLQKANNSSVARPIEITATDIELPMTSPLDDLPEIHKYSFYVLADGSSNVANGLKIEVLGVDPVEIQPVEQQKTYFAQTPRQTNRIESVESKSVWRVSVNSENVTRSFSILAWHPEEADKWEKKKRDQLDQLDNQIVDEELDFGLLSEINSLKEERKRIYEQENPWSQRKEVKVYKGDLRTQIVLESQDNVARMFGNAFARNFFVGRVYLRNKRSDMRLVVYTTSLRVNALFYREPFLAAKNLATDNPGAGDEDGYLDLKSMMSIIDSVKKMPMDETPDQIVNSMPKSDRTGVARQLTADAMAKFQASINSKTAFPDQWLTNSGLEESKLPEARRELSKIANSKASVEKMLNEFGSSPTLKSLGVNDAIKAEYETTIKRASKELIEKYAVPQTSLSWRPGITASPAGRTVAMSADPSRQTALAAHGYLWRDYYRPMTFQSVLNALLDINQQKWQSQVVDALETAGMVAGGLMGFGPVMNEFKSLGYVESVAFSTSVFIPAAKRILLDDLEKHIKNLGDMGMDTVLIIPPNGVVDKYVFFPRGPLFFGMDEFNVKNPSYIVELSNNDVPVQAMLIERSQELDAGVVSADKLVADAIDMGRSVRDAENQKLLEVNKQARALRSALLSSQVEKMVTAGRTNEAEAVLNNYEALYGKEQGGFPDQLRQKYAIDSFQLTPLIRAIGEKEIFENETTRLPVLVDRGGAPLQDLKITVSTTNSALFATNQAVEFSTNWVLVLTPLTNKTGTAQMTVRAVAPSGREAVLTFNVTVAPRPLDLSLTNPVVLDENAKLTAPIQAVWGRFPIEQLRVTVSNTNYTVFPPNTIQATYNQGKKQWEVTFNPAKNTFGDDEVVVTANSPTGSAASNRVAVRVSAVAPTIRFVGTESNRVVVPENQSQSVQMAIAKSGTESSNLIVSAQTDAVDLFDTNKLRPVLTNGAWVLPIAPKANRFGTSVVLVTATTEKKISAISNLTVAVPAVAPRIAPIPDIAIRQNSGLTNVAVDISADSPTLKTALEVRDRAAFKQLDLQKDASNHWQLAIEPATNRSVEAQSVTITAVSPNSGLAATSRFNVAIPAIAPTLKAVPMVRVLEGASTNIVLEPGGGAVDVKDLRVAAYSSTGAFSTNGLAVELKPAGWVLSISGAQMPVTNLVTLIVSTPANDLGATQNVTIVVDPVYRPVTFANMVSTNVIKSKAKTLIPLTINHHPNFPLAVTIASEGGYLSDSPSLESNGVVISSISIPANKTNTLTVTARDSRGEYQTNLTVIWRTNLPPVGHFPDSIVLNKKEKASIFVPVEDAETALNQLKIALRTNSFVTLETNVIASGGFKLYLDASSQAATNQVIVFEITDSELTKEFQTLVSVR